MNNRLENEATLHPINEILPYLQETIGQKLTTYIIGSTKSDDYPTKIQYTYAVVQALENAFDSDTTKTWLLGTNTKLNEKSPASAIRNAKDLNEYRIIIQAAYDFAGVSN